MFERSVRPQYSAPLACHRQSCHSINVGGPGLTTCVCTECGFTHSRSIGNIWDLCCIMNSTVYSINLKQTSSVGECTRTATFSPRNGMARPCRWYPVWREGRRGGGTDPRAPSEGPRLLRKLCQRALPPRAICSGRHGRVIPPMADVRDASPATHRPEGNHRTMHRRPQKHNIGNISDPCL